MPAGALLLVETAFAAGPTLGDALEDACERLDPGSPRAAPRLLRARAPAGRRPATATPPPISGAATGTY